MRVTKLTGSLDSTFHRGAVTGRLIAVSLAGALCAAPGAASAEDRPEHLNLVRTLGEDLDAWTTTDGRIQLARKDERELRACDYTLTTLTKGNASPGLTFDLEHDTPDLRAGKHAWTEPPVRQACDRILAAVERRGKVSMVVWAIHTCMNNADKVHQVDAAERTYKEALAAGIPPSEPINSEGLTGTMGALYEQWCQPAKAKLDAAEQARAAPYKKRLKSDKLRIALQDTDFIMLPGGGKATPERLAASNVWFEDASPARVCANGLPVHVLHRYQFDAQQKLLRVTDREFCGHPPASALR